MIGDASFQQATVQKLLAAGKLHDAALVCNTLTDRHPTSPQSWALASTIALKLCQPDKAIEFAQRAVALAPHAPRALILLATALRAHGLQVQAASKAVQAAAICAQDSAAWNDLGSYYSEAEEFAAALHCFTRAAEFDSESPTYRFNRAATLRIVGDLAAAEADYDRVVMLKRSEHEAYYNRSDLRRQTPSRNHVEELKTLLAAGIRHPRSEVFIRYALAKELEDLGCYQDSFAELSRAAALRRRHIHYDVAHDTATVDWIRAAFPLEQLHVRKGAAPPAEPIFIVGMPRTGTTLVERMLGSHSGVFGAGELPHFANALVAAARSLTGRANLDRKELIEACAKLPLAPVGLDYLARTRPRTGHTPRFVDKLPLNYLYCGLIRLALPNARIVHMTRHPMASCYAMYKTLFKDVYPFSYDLQELGNYYAGYVRLMSHWHTAMPHAILVVRYETLVENFEAETRRILDYCDLPFEAACLNFHRNPNPTITASAAQVRLPLYDTSVNQWRHYERELEPLRSVLLAAGVSAVELDA